jgi:hypothetical protein
LETYSENQEKEERTLKIAVCVKQTFDTEAKIVLKDGKISGDGINLIINPYDEVAVEEALQYSLQFLTGGSCYCKPHIIPVVTQVVVSYFTVRIDQFCDLFDPLLRDLHGA